MTKTFIALGVLAVLAIVIRLLERFARRRRIYDYDGRPCIMSSAERECFGALNAELGNEFHFFPQIHLDCIVCPKNPRQQFGAFRHISQKSVDFVACDKVSLRPICVIEVDDKTHQRPSRMVRDKEVARILTGAGIPLVRVQNRGRFEPKLLAELVRSAMKNF